MTLCARCENFDIQAFTKDAHGLRGYLIKDVRESARLGCEFCQLLIECSKNLKLANWAESRWNGTFIHMAISENYEMKVVGSGRQGLSVNRLILGIGPRYISEDYTKFYRRLLINDKPLPRDRLRYARLAREVVEEICMVAETGI